MKNLVKTSMLMTLIAIAASGCGKTTTTATKKNTATTSTSTTTTSTSATTGSSDPTNLSACNGVARSGASRCYFTEIPKLQFSGTSLTGSVNNVQIWTSKSLPSTFSQNNLQTDASFNVRIKPSVATSGSSQQGRTCAGPMAYNFTRVKVYFMLRREGDSITTIYETTASLNTYGTKLSLPVIGGTSSPYILEIMGVESDHRCNAAYGTLSTNEKAACTAGTYWGGIPLVSGSNPTSCIALNVEFSTDSTYDLP